MNLTLRLLFVLLYPMISLGQTNFNELVWSDEFNINGAPNPTYWSYDIGQSGWGNNEMQNYTSASQNVRVENGSLIIDAIKSSGVWTSARLKSQSKKSFTYGRIVFRAKLPTGSGTWPALWMLGENISSVGWPACGEIDIMEHVGRNPGVVQSVLHTPSSFGNTVNLATTTVETFATEYHTYELRWTPDKMEFFVDDIKFYTYAPSVKNSSTWPFSNPQFIIMNIAMGGNLGSDAQFETGGLKNGIDPALTQARMEIDYVRVYQEFSTLQIAGSTILQKNQSNVVFSTNIIENATYEWAVPNDAQIVSGQGTNQITVNWGTTEGEVSVKVNVNSVLYEKSTQIVIPVKPQGSIYHLTSPEFGIEWIDRDPNNLYSISDDEGVTQINYSVTNLSSLGVQGNFFRPLDMTDHAILRASIRSYNKSNTLNMRMDLVDANDNATSKTPVFNLFPLIDDGEYYTYSFDYQNQNGWLSSSSAVNASLITKMNFYIDFGAFAAAGEDSLWIQDIWVEDGTSPPLLNRPSHLEGSIDGNSVTLQWKDNSQDEDGFEIFQSASPDGLFEKTETLPPDSKIFNLVLGDDLTRYYYRVRSFNASSNSDFSNTIQPQLITGIESKLSHHVQIYPNPSHGVFYIVSNFPEVIQIKIKDSGGRLLLQQVQTPSQTTIDLSQVSKGSYILEIISRGQIVHKKIILF